MFCFGWNLLTVDWSCLFQSPRRWLCLAKGGSWAPQSPHNEPLTVKPSQLCPVHLLSLNSQFPQFTSCLCLPTSCSALLASVSRLSQDLLSSTTFEVLVLVLYELHTGEV